MLNAGDFPASQPSQEVKLKALGFDESGHRGGGILQPRAVTLPTDAVILRLYKPVEKAGEYPGAYGSWWFTPHEYRRLCDHFGVDGRALIPGRSTGRSALHGVLALMKEWYDDSPNQLAYLNAVRLTQPLFACYGAGAPGNSDGYARTLKPVTLSDGQTARQIYIHQCWLYQTALQPLVPENTSTDTVLSGASSHSFMSAPRMSFEP